MKTVKLILPLLLTLALLTGCVQINVPPAQKEDTEGGASPSDTGPVTGDTAPVTEAQTLPKEPILVERFSVSSSESESVILRVDLRAETYDGKTANVTASVYITYGKLSKGKSTGTVTLNGESKTFSVPPIEKQTESIVTVNRGTFHFTVGLDSVKGTELVLETVWDLDETVDGEYVETLNASATFPFWAGTKQAEESGTTGSEAAATPKMISETCE